jgi:uncharacterized protein YqgC (DUF456 family)
VRVDRAPMTRGWILQVGTDVRVDVVRFSPGGQSVSLLVGIGIIAAMLACVALIPLGLPGLWLIVVMVFGMSLGGLVSWTTALVIAGIAAAAEAAEFLVLSRLGRRYGASRRAFWGAVIGGMAGLFVGLPVPVVGSVVTAFLGTFAGAGLVTWMETASLGRSARVGWGVLLARTLAVGLKVGVAVGVVGFVALALLF